MSIKEIIVAGKKKSKTFAGLLRYTKITPDNYKDRIEYGDCTKTDSETGKITLEKAEHLGTQVIKLTHELTNLKNAEKYQKLMDMALTNEITPEDFAILTSVIERDGQINQVKVAAEGGFRFEKEEYNDLIEAYSKDKSIDLSTIIEPYTEYLKIYEMQAVTQKALHDMGLNEDEKENMINSLTQALHSLVRANDTNN